jgi:PAS domain S-box-containing protein
MESEWKWDKLDPAERQIAELLLQGKSNAAICQEVFLSRARVQECIKRIQIKTQTESTRAAIVLLVEERETQALLGILDQASDGVVIIQDRLRKFANTALGSILGYDAEDKMAGMPFVEFIAPRSRDKLIKNYDLRMQGEPFPGEYVATALCKGGQEKNLLITSAGLVQYKGRRALLAIAKSLEVEEWETQTLLRVLDAASDAVVIIQDLIVKFANRTFHDMHGYAPHELTGRPMVDLLTPGSWDHVKNQYKLGLKSQLLVDSYEISVLCKGGEEKKALVARGGHILYKGREALLLTIAKRT